MANSNNNKKKGKRVKLQGDAGLLKKFKLVVAYSHIERENFPTDDAYDAEVENEIRDPVTGSRHIVREERMLFVVTPKDSLWPESLGMVKGV